MPSFSSSSFSGFLCSLMSILLWSSITHHPIFPLQPAGAGMPVPGPGKGGAFRGQRLPGLCLFLHSPAAEVVGVSGSASSVATLSAAKLGLIQFQSPVCLLPRQGSLTPRSRSLSETRLRKGAEPRARRGTGAGKARSGQQDVAACELCQRSVLCASCTDRERMNSLCLPAPPASPVVWAVL